MNARWLVTALVAIGFLAGAWVETDYLRAWFLRRSAEQAFYRGDFHGSLARYEQVRALLPDRPRSHTEIADSVTDYIESQGEFLSEDEFADYVARAVRDYLIAIRKGPPNAWSYAGLGALAGTIHSVRIRREGLPLSELSGDPASLHPEDRLSEAAWVKAVQIEPHDFYYRDFLGDFYLRRGFQERALQHFHAAVKLHPVLERHYYLSDFATASPAVLATVEDAIREALAWEETEVSEFDIHRFLADIYLRLGRLADARASLEAAARVTSRPEAMDVRIGQLLVREGDDARALEAFRRAAERKPDYNRAWLHLGLTLSRAGRHDEAIEAARRARGLKPGDFVTVLALGRVLEAAGRHDEAADVLESLIRNHRERQQAYMQLIGIYEKQGQLAHAVRVARRLVDAFPHEPLYAEQLEQLETKVRSNP